MRTLKIFLTSSLLLLTASAAHAEFGVGVIGSYHVKDSYTFSGAFADSATAQTSSSVGVLGFFPVFPYFSLRFGAMYEQLNMTANYTSGISSSSIRMNNLLIPLDLQFDIPATDLYVFGGVVEALNQSTSASSGAKAQNDTRINVGAGYNFISFAGLKLSAEIEDEMGSHSIAPNTDYNLKLNSWDFNLIARFTL